MTDVGRNTGVDTVTADIPWSAKKQGFAWLESQELYYQESVAGTDVGLETSGTPSGPHSTYQASSDGRAESTGSEARRSTTGLQIGSMVPVRGVGGRWRSCLNLLHLCYRLTINANCPMNLHNFPMDTQRCPLQLGSFAYTTRDVVYRWNEERRIVIAPDLMLSQFDLIATPSGFENTTRRAAGEFSTLLASFYLQRHMGNFLIQVYGPCMLLVVLSWVSFWLNREATSDRISLGITTVLTMTFLGLEARTDLPKVSYSTALDLFVWLSYGFIFATIIEFAFVHIFTKVGSGEVYLSGVCSGADSDDDDDDDDDDQEQELDDLDVEHLQHQYKQQHLQHQYKQQHHQEQQPHQRGRREVTKMKPTSPKVDQMNSVSNIDEASRVLFPLSFLCINLVYWYTYLSHSS
nr:gamma-aminobutyric acid receptor subunit alpha-2-like [Procambarus clarkii]